MIKGSILSDGNILFHGYPSVSGQTHRLFKNFLGNALLVFCSH
jgi:hypothetical protein